MVQGMVQPDQREGPVARNIERQTSKLPSDFFLWAALGAMTTSLVMQSANHPHRAQFFGQWVPTLLLFGVYNKIVKVAGSDRYDRGGDFGGNRSSLQNG